MNIPMDKKPSSIDLLQNHTAHEYQSQLQKLISLWSDSTIGQINALKFQGLLQDPMEKFRKLNQEEMLISSKFQGLLQDPMEKFRKLNQEEMLISSKFQGLLQDPMEKFRKLNQEEMFITSKFQGLLQDPMEKFRKAYQEEMSITSKFQGLLQDPMEKFRKAYQEEMSITSKYQGLIQDPMEKFREPQLRLQGLAFPSNSFILEQLSNALKTQSFLQEKMETISDVCINDDGTFSIDNELISVESVSECINSMFIDDECNVDFIERLKKLSSPTRAVVLYLLQLIIIPYFVAIYANLTTPLWEGLQKESISSEPRTAKKEIIREKNEIYSAEYLQDYRLVSTKNLSVRTSGNKNAEIIDELYFGKTVKLIEKTKSWCLIEYQNPDTEKLKQGWVFSRYLSRFSK
jgi:hypothetical protein